MREGPTDQRKQVVAAGYDAIADQYLEWAGQASDPARQRFLEELIGRLRPGASVLDLGCGAGIPTAAYLSEEFAVTGVDISAGQVDAARRNVPAARFIHADMATVELPEASFDAVLALYSLSHLPRDEHGPALARIARWLRPNGLLVANLGAHDSPDWTGPWLGGRDMFFSSFDATENLRLVSAAGFQLILSEVAETHEPEGAVRFLWILAVKVAPAKPADGD